MPVNVLGYSERGMIGALCYDMSDSEPSAAALEQFLGLISFPFQAEGTPVLNGITHAEILIEQSFSRFGDPDLVILIEAAGVKHALFIEAKVHTDVKRGRTINERWLYFVNALANGQRKKLSSALFAQLYRKQRLIRKLRNRTEELPVDYVTGPGRPHFGGNRIVRRAADKVQDYTCNSWVVALLPEPGAQVDEFFHTTLAQYRPDPRDMADWNVQNWGFVTWKQVEDMCQQHEAMWQRTLASFDWNREQIYDGWDRG